jgi:hypothetical protein
MAAVVAAERAAMAARPEAKANRFLIRWPISAASRSRASSASLRGVLSRKTPNMVRPTMPWSAPRPRADTHPIPPSRTMRKSKS